MRVEPAPGEGMPEWLGRRAALSPDRPALITTDKRWSFQELHAGAVRAAGRLAGLGIGEGDRVALLLPNGAHFVEMLHALVKLSAVLVPLNLRLGVAELAWQLSDVRPSLLICGPETLDTALALRERIPDLTCATVAPARPTTAPSTPEARPDQAVGFDQAPDHSPAAAAVPGGEGDSSIPVIPHLARADAPLRERVDLSATHCIIYTSGTTGRPKGALITYGNHWWSAVASSLNLHHHGDDRWLACLPLYHVSGLSILMKSIIYGIPAVVQPRFDAAAVNRAIEETRVTIVSVVSNMLSRMLEGRGDRPYPAWLRCVLLGGGPAPGPLLEACAARGIPVAQTYGLTETNSQAATLAPADALRKLGSAGKPLFPNELRIEVDGDGAAAHEPGEILVRGPTVTPGYYERPEETAAALRDGWLHTGDTGYLDDEGYLYVLDRRADLIVSGGENVYPAEVEAALLAHPDVLEAGVTGIPDANWGRVPAAAVRLREGGEAPVSEDALLAFCRSRLAGYKVPRRIRLVEALPHNGAGKLLRRSLPELFEA